MNLMKTFYSSTFFTIILAFLALMGQSAKPVILIKDTVRPQFRTIVNPDHFNLKSDSKVKIEVFNNFDCHDCDLFGQGNLKQIVENYANKQEFDFYLYMTPNKENENEIFAVRGAYCAEKYNKFWDFIYKMHSADSINKKTADLLGQELEFPIEEFRNCLNSDAFDKKIEESIAHAKERKVDVLPSIFVNDTLLIGAQPIENVEKVVRQYQKKLSELKKQTKL